MAALVSVSSPAVRGLFVGAATAAKFAPVVLWALLARVGRERVPSIVAYGAAAVAVVVVCVAAYLPPSGVRGFWDSTIGFQLKRSSPFSIWGLHPGLASLHTVVTVGVAAMAAAAFVLGRRASTVQLAAAGAALLYGVQLVARHWYYFYLPWALPYALVALFSLSRATSVRNSGSSSASAVASNSS